MLLSSNPKKVVALIMTKRAPSAEKPANPEMVDEPFRAAMDAFIDAVHGKDVNMAMEAFEQMVMACKSKGSYESDED